MKKKVLISAVAILLLSVSLPFVFNAIANPTGGCLHNNPGTCDYGDGVTFKGYMIPEQQLR